MKYIVGNYFSWIINAKNLSPLRLILKYIIVSYFGKVKNK